MSRKVSICMIGAGRVGKLHSGTLKRYLPDGDVVALVDTQVEMLQSTGREFGIEAQFTSLEEALDKAEFDAVVITTPTPSHEPLAVMAAEAQKHVFLEKPMAMDLKECDRIIVSCQKNGSTCSWDLCGTSIQISAWHMKGSRLVKLENRCLLNLLPMDRAFRRPGPGT